MTKQCSICEKVFEDVQSSFYSTTTSHCKECSKEYSKQRYHKYIEAEHQRNQAKYLKIKNDSERLNLLNARRRERRKSNPEVLKVQIARRRAKRHGLTEHFTQQEWLELCIKYNNTCLRCESRDCFLTADHIVPLSKGGTNLISNIQPLCFSCNSSKRTKDTDFRVLFEVKQQQSQEYVFNDC